MDFDYISECVSTTTDDVVSAMDSLYIKQLSILEYDNDLDKSEYQCFQEGFIKPKSKELDVFKFDNSHILKAIKCFNKAYSDLPFELSEFDEIKNKQENGKLSLESTHAPSSSYSKEFINTAAIAFKKTNGKFTEGFRELEKQFDCKFKLMISANNGATGTLIRKFPSEPGSLTVSKKEGFKLGGLGIIISINVSQVLGIAPAKHEFFGQSFTAVLLHEIYHNIVHMIDIRNKRLHDDIKDTMSQVGKSKNIVSTTSNLTSFVERFAKMFKLKNSDIKKKRAVNRLYVLSQIQNNTGAMKKFEDDIKNDKDPTNSDKELDEYIENLQKITVILNIRKGARVVSVACSILLSAIGFAFGSVAAAVVGTVSLAIMSLGMLMKKVISLFGVTPYVQEEYFCDLFAAMYKLPIHLVSYKRQIELNKKNRQKVGEIRKLDQKIDKLEKDIHPMTFDRELTSYRIAKQLLESEKHLKKDIKEYLQYIVDLHEGIEDIDNPDSKRQRKKLSPESAADLRKTLRDFVVKSGAVVTESFIMDMCNINGGEYYGVG